MNITRSFRVPVYGGRLRLYTDRAALAEYCQRLGATTPAGDGMTCTAEDSEGSRVYIVGWLDGRISTLAHELNHVALRILARVGINPTDSNGEALCHLLGELMTLCGADEFERPLVTLPA